MNWKNIQKQVQPNIREIFMVIRFFQLKPRLVLLLLITGLFPVKSYAMLNGQADLIQRVQQMNREELNQAILSPGFPVKHLSDQQIQSLEGDTLAQIVSSVIRQDNFADGVGHLVVDGNSIRTSALTDNQLLFLHGRGLIRHALIMRGYDQPIPDALVSRLDGKDLEFVIDNVLSGQG